MTHHTFEEIQRFNQLWLWGMIISVSLIVMIQIPLTLITAAGEEPIPISSILILLFSLAFVIGMNALFIFSRLKSIIDDTGISITFPPFINKLKIFRWDEIEKARIRKYKPIWEYGGWGFAIGGTIAPIILLEIWDFNLS